MYRMLAAVAGVGLIATGPASFAEDSAQSHGPVTGYVPLEPGMGVVVQGAPQSRILFLNRCAGGCTIVPGINDSRIDRSSIPATTSQLAPFPHGDPIWNRVVACVETLYAEFDIEVTDVDPGPDTPHFEAIVAGQASDIGLGVDAGGVSPFACGVIDNAITFTFAERLGANAQRLCEVIGQESAHAFGLDHETLCEDPLTYKTGCGSKCFRDQVAECGEQNPRACYCGGTTQNSWQAIAALFGTREPAFAAGITAPAPGAEVEAGFLIRAEPRVPCWRVVEAWLDTAGETLYLGDIHTTPFVFNTPYELPHGPVTVRVAVTDVDGEVYIEERAVTVGDGPDSGPAPGCPGGSCGAPRPPDTGGCAASHASGSTHHRGAALAGLALLLAAVVRRRRGRTA